MQVTISLTRRTEYSAIVEMSDERYERLKEGLESDNPTERKNAQLAIDRFIDQSDWQDDTLLSIDEFEPCDD